MAEHGKVILHPGRRIADNGVRLSLQELGEVVGEIGRCLAEIGSEPSRGHGFGQVTTTPILLQMTAVEQRLENLSEITVTTWPDARWALLFCHARSRALTSIRESTALLEMARQYGESTRAWEGGAGFVDFGALRRALRGVRDLIVERYPQTLPA
jgi:hypothetical protein